jgi:asparagine synthase (glutamine-hydrolysing)
MSGICGMLALKGQRPDEVILERMVSSLTHRGPDDSGWTTIGPCGLGHTCLAVMEHDGTIRQPLMVTHTPSRTHIPQESEAWITHDGEIYNFDEIHTMLKATRHHFASYTDTEAVLRAYLQFGSPNFIKAFRGKYAFAIWDE